MFGPQIEMIECQALYNMLNEGIEYAKISDLYFLYLLDCRQRADYNEGHILSAKNIKRNDDSNKSFRLPYEAELESKNVIIVYDGNTTSLQENNPAMECAKLISENASKYSVKILKGGYEAFSKYYPFLRKQQILYMPKEMDELKTYPSEIIPGLLYLGNLRHGTQQYIKKDLKLKSYIECLKTSEDFKFKNEKSIDYLKIPIEDDSEQPLENFVEQSCNFLDTNIKNRKQPCLVFSELGISRSAAIIIAYLVYSERITVEEAFERVNKCRKIQPQVAFLEKISKHFSDRKLE